MAQPTNIVTSATLRGMKEDFDNKIYLVDAEDTPGLSAMSSFKVTNRVHQWQEDSLAAANKDNARSEGDDFSGNVQTPTFILANHIQTFTKDVVTSGVANEVSKYGRSSEQDYLTEQKATLELKTDVEASFFSNNVGVTTAGATAGKTASLELFATSTAQHGVGGSTAALTSGVVPAAAPTDGAQRVLTEAILTAGLRAAWQNGFKPKVAYLSLGQKNVVNAFAGIATRQVNVMPKGMASIIGVVNVYVWETGPTAFVPMYDDRIRTRTMFITDGECLKRGVLRPISRKKMGATGDSTKEMLVTDALLKVTNRVGVLKIADLT